MIILLMAFQLAAWQHITVTDPVRASQYDKFVLQGEYLEPPASYRVGDTPKIIVTCANSKIINAYGLVPTMLWSGGVRIEARILGKVTSSSIGVSYSKDPALTGDDTGRPYSLFDIKKVLPKLLEAQSDIPITVRDEIRGPSGRSPRQVLMSFPVADHTDLETRCGIKK